MPPKFLLAPLFQEVITGCGTAHPFGKTPAIFYGRPLPFSQSVAGDDYLNRSRALRYGPNHQRNGFTGHPCFRERKVHIHVDMPIGRYFNLARSNKYGTTNIFKSGPVAHLEGCTRDIAL
ncbi:MAG: hypothetical protein LBS64_02670, partial [Spirochaetaceae bacterium]|nr:hypothetical protein [Spirochaetaceae bacterium]